jgi:hypothetical protein
VNPRIKALFFISRCLANDTRPESVAALRTEMHSTRLSWEAVVSLANGQLITPALWVALKNKGLTAELPDELRSYLGELHRLNVARNSHLRAQLLEAVQQLNNINVSPVLLKGAMHLVTDMYGDPGARIMADIDLLVPAEDTERCMTALQELQYKPVKDIQNNYNERHHHNPPLFRRGAYGVLEIHRRVIKKQYEEILPTETAMAASEPLVLQGLSMKVLSPTHRTLHNLLHSQLVDQNYHTGIFSLRSLHEMVIEYSACHDRLNWPMIQSLMERHNRRNVFHTYLYQAHRLLGFPLPACAQKTFGCWLYFWRCVAEAGWQTCENMGHRMQRYSADNICQTHGCDNAWIPVNLARLKQVKRRLSTRPDGTKPG